MRFLVTGFVLLSILLGQGCSKPPYTDIDPARVQALLSQGVALYDIRRPDEWKMTGVIEGSRKLTFVDESGRLMPGFLTRFSQAVAKDQPVIIMCQVGSRSAVLARYLMEEQGYTRVYNAEQGIRGWLREQRPVVGGLARGA